MYQGIDMEGLSLGIYRYWIAHNVACNRLGTLIFLKMPVLVSACCSSAEPDINGAAGVSV